MEKQVFEQIWNCIPNKYDKRKKLPIALDIYLTWCGIRPSCRPFGFKNDNLELEIESKDVEAFILNINKINKLQALLGPYVPEGNLIIVYNTESTAKLLMDKIAKLRNILDKTDNEIHTTVKTQKNIPKTLRKNKTIKNNSYIIDKLIGKLNGNTCEFTPSSLKSKKSYIVGYGIRDFDWNYAFGCAFNRQKQLYKSIAKLDEIRTALTKLDLPQEITRDVDFFVKIIDK